MHLEIAPDLITGFPRLGIVLTKLYTSVPVPIADIPPCPTGHE